MGLQWPSMLLLLLLLLFVDCLEALWLINNLIRASQILIVLYIENKQIMTVSIVNLNI